MILVSAGLVLTAIVLLIAGFVLGQAYLVMWSIAISLLSAVFLVIGALLRRHELFPGGHAGAAPAFPQKGPVPAGPLPAPHMMSNQTSPHPPQMMMPRGMQQAATVAAQPRLSPMARPVPAARQGPLNDGAIVLVIPGRKRYHVAGCRQLVGRDHEELTHEEAREEGFTPCTTCLPESIAGTKPQDAPAGAREPVKPLPQAASSQESSSSGATREPGHHEATARFTSPYKPVASSARQETSAPGQETVVPPARPYAHPPAAQAPPSEPARTRSQKPGETRPQEPTRQSRPQEPVSPPLRTGQPAVPSFPFLSPPIPEIPSAESEATSWFNRDAVAPSESGTEAPANPDPELVKPGSPAESESAKRKPAEPGSPTAAKPSTRLEASARSEAPARSEAQDRSETSAESPAARPEAPGPEPEPEPVEPETIGSRTVKPGVAGSEPVKSEASGSQAATPEIAESAKSGTASAKTASAKGEAPEASSAEVKRKAPAVPAPAEPADDVAEPVESAETAPGRAGQPVPADLTPAESAAAGSDEAAEQPAQKAQERVPFEDRDDDDTSPGGIPVIWDQSGSADPETESGPETEPGAKREAVKVIAGTRRFHDSDCPLIKGMGGSGVETMSQSEAEDAGLTSCPVCLSDH